MNTNDIDIELPPLPKGDIAADTCPVMWVHSNEQLQAYALAAIEAVHKRGGEPVGYFYPWELERSLKAYPNGFPGAVAVYAAPQPAEPVQSDCYKECAIGDSNYAAGMLLGWNLCIDNDEEKFNRIRRDRLSAAAQASHARRIEEK